MQTKANGKLLSVSTIEEEYGIRASLVYHWIRYRKFSVIKIDKKVLIPRAEFDDFLNCHFIPGGDK